MDKMKKNQVVVITGASAGVGRATARAFARRRACIGLLARGKERLESAVKDIRELGGEGLAIPTDVADPAQVEHAAQEVEQAFGPPDIWVNDAMTTVFSPFKDMTPEEFKRVTEVTYLGYVYGTMAALKRMIPLDRGTIVQVGSALAVRSIPLQSAYCGAKHGIQGFTDSIRSELIHDRSNVYITMVQMPALNTPQFQWCKSRMPRKAQPVPPIFQPEVAADAILWAVDHKTRELYVGWPTVEAIWGQKFVPGFVDRYLAKTNYQAQQYDGLDDPNRASNLWEPVPGDFAAHGSFDQRARSQSSELWTVEKIGLTKLVISASALVLAGAASFGVALAERVGKWR